MNNKNVLSLLQIFILFILKSLKDMKTISSSSQRCLPRTNDHIIKEKGHNHVATP